MAPVIFAVSDGPGVGVPRVNFVAIAILLASAGLGMYQWRVTGSLVLPAAILAGGLVLIAVVMIRGRRRRIGEALPESGPPAATPPTPPEAPTSAVEP